MNQNRRDFVKTISILSASASSVAATLTRTLTDSDNAENPTEVLLNSRHEFYIIDNNLLNLKFYFINTKQVGHFLKPNVPGPHSYMIIRLPQMHVSERGFWDDMWSVPNNQKASANLSGFSYLAFQLWPDQIGLKDKNGKCTKSTLEKDKKIRLSIDSLLDWNDTRSFDLITLVEWFRLSESGATEFAVREAGNAAYYPNAECVFQTDKDEPSSAIYVKYRGIICSLLEKNLPNSKKVKGFVPVTFFEVPQGMCLIPFYRDKSGKLFSLNCTEQVLKKFGSNNYFNQEKTPADIRTYEIWANSLYYQRQSIPDGKAGTAKFSVEKPGFRAAGLIGLKPVAIPKTIEDCTALCDAQRSEDRNILPSLLDKTELAYLTQYAADFTGEVFDINEVDGLFISGLGIITHLHYENVDNCPDGVDLIEYEHSITQGRDVHIKVSRLGYHSKFGHRYKHIIEGTRTIDMKKFCDEGSAQPVSFIQFKQYCERIDETITNPKPEEILPGWSDQYENIAPIPASPILSPVSNKSDHKRHVFQSITVNEPKRVPIDCLNGYVRDREVCQVECLPWFWPILESDDNFYTLPNGNTAGKPETDPSIQYSKSIFNALDWENQNISSSTPFMFIRKTYLENEGRDTSAYDNYLKPTGVWTVQGVLDPRVERRKIYFNNNNNKIAFTPSLPDDGHGVAESKVKNKVNILETEFIDTYFNLKKFGAFVENNINKTPYVVYPQMLRARVYIDHIRDLTQQKIASVVEHNQDYIDQYFDDYKQAAGVVSGNGAKLILNLTNAYTTNIEEPLSNTYTQLTGALQAAKSRLGNLAVPDIFPSTISLTSAGITMPQGIESVINSGHALLSQAADGEKTIDAISPASILGNTEICGIKITDILRTFIPSLPDNDSTPLFNINKTLNEAEGEVEKSPVYQAIINYTIADPFDAAAPKLTPKDLVQKYLDKVNGAITKLNGYKDQLNQDVKLLSAQIPDTDTINHLVKDLFEHYRTIAFDLALEELPLESVVNTINNAKNAANSFLTTEKNLLLDEYNSKKNELAIFKTRITNEVSKLPATLITTVDPDGNIYKIDTWLSNHLGAVLDLVDNQASVVTALYSTGVEIEITSGTDTVYYVCDATGTSSSVTGQLTNDPTKGKHLKALDASGAQPLATCGYYQLQKKITDFQYFISNNIGKTAFQNAAAIVIQGLLANYNTQINNVTTAAALKIQNTIDTFLSDIDIWVANAKNYLTNNINIPPETTDAINTSVAIFLQVKPYGDFVRKYDPWFYYSRQQQLNLQIKDVQRRFIGSLIAYYGTFNPNGTLNCDNTSILCEVQAAIAKYNTDIQQYFTCLGNVNALPATCKATLSNDMQETTNEVIGGIAAKIMNLLKATPAYQQADHLYQEINTLKGQINTYEQYVQQYTTQYQTILQQEAETFAQPLIDSVTNYIAQQTALLASTVNAGDIDEILDDINEAQNIYNLLTSLKQQDLTYTWSTDDFSDTDFGIISFLSNANPNTTLKVNVRVTTYFNPGVFPPTISRIETLAENYFTDFALSFMNSLTLGFSEVSFIAGTGRASQFNVKIKDVSFGGALSFVQAFEEYLQTIGKGLTLRQESDYIALSYSIAIPDIEAPAFSFFNLSLNFDLRVYFDNRPILFVFSLATPDAKFGIAAFIYAGFGYFEIGADPKNGVVLLSIDLEAGAYEAISIGPISGEVKLAFGFLYSKEYGNVRLEGYIVAEGRLSVWIVEVSARIYLGIISDNGVVEGACIVSYSVSVGFISKTFTATYFKRIAGAQSKNNQEYQNGVNSYHAETLNLIQKRGVQLQGNFYNDLAIVPKPIADDNTDTVEVTYAVSDEEWSDFITLF